MTSESVVVKGPAGREKIKEVIFFIRERRDDSQVENISLLKKRLISNFREI